MAYMTTVRSRKHPAPSHLLVLMASALPIAAHAQEIEKTLPATTVKAEAEPPYKAERSSNPKLTQPLVDTPQTIQVIKKEILQEQGAATLMDALRNTPGITMQLGENGNTSAGDTFQMRGFATQTSMFVDGIRDLGAVTRDVFNLEQVEIIKGPAGGDIGRGSQSGYINLISKLPQLENNNSASISYGTEDYKRGVVDINRQLSDDTALRLNLMAQDSGVAGRDHVHNKRAGFAPSIAFGLNSPTRLYLYSQHVRQDNVPDGGIPTIGMEGFYNSNSVIAKGGKVDRENFYGSKNDYEKIKADMATAKFEHDLSPDTTIRNIFRVGRTSMDRILTGVFSIAAVTPSDPTTWTVSRIRQRVDQINDIAANQTSLNTGFMTGSIKHEFSVGLELMYERQKSLGFSTAGLTIPAANLYAPNHEDNLPKPYKTGAYTDGDTKTVAAYVFDTLKLNERWQLNAGLRIDHFKTNTESRTLSNNVLMPSKVGLSDNLLSWKAGAVYKPASNGSIYAAYAKSMTPPGSGNFSLSTSSTSQQNAAMDPQETINYELGTKWELLDKRLSLTAAVYRTDNEKQVSYDSFSDSYFQEGKTRVDGIELAAVGQLTRSWQIAAGVAKMKTKQIDQLSKNSSGAVSETTGVRWSPDLTATLWTSYSVGDFTFGGGSRYVSDQKRVITAGTPLATQNMPKIDSYWVTDLMFAYKINKNLNLRLNIYNVFDKEYIATLNNSGARMTLGAPRTALLSAELQF